MTVPSTTASSFTPHATPTGRRETLGAFLDALSVRRDFARHLHDHVTYEVFGGPQASGRDAVEQLILAIHAQIFDAEVLVRRMVVNGSGACAELLFVGTHTGEFAGVAASGRRVEVPCVDAFDFAADGRISAIRAYLPMHLLLAQIGAASTG
jgi:predicted ester cyclase